jgi:1-pyrroline-5-carboxylate dehydrogenase
VGYLDPLNGQNQRPFIHVCQTDVTEIDAFVDSLNTCPKHGLHNPFKNPERYVMLGTVCAKIAARMKEPEVMEFFSRLIQRVAPKSYAQAYGEVAVTQKFIENFGGDQVRFLARGFSVPGDHTGQVTELRVVSDILI